ncbi:hypothetical protein [Actimicrobium antarcticum]|uniref:Uncharacterized protein n=1 Tax=Actimicrobium antarcticum TaxID=1051899 RepID=A0ABP7TU72_9BURK
MVTDAFIDWWFAPWNHAGEDAPPIPGDDAVGKRDAYRNWCAEAHVASDFPLQFDPAWSIVAGIEQAQLQHTASLFMGLIAARQPDQSVLRSLPFDDQKWCLSIAATQPLQPFSVNHPQSQDDVHTRGLAELAIRLEQGFPGLWSRLQLGLPLAIRSAVAIRMQNCWADQNQIARSSIRSQRCWRWCRQRSEAHS